MVIYKIGDKVRWVKNHDDFPYWEEFKAINQTVQIISIYHGFPTVFYRLQIYIPGHGPAFSWEVPESCIRPIEDKKVLIDSDLYS